MRNSQRAACSDAFALSLLLVLSNEIHVFKLQFLSRRRYDVVSSCAAKIFQAIQGHWLSASLGVIMQLKVPEILAETSEPIGFKEVSFLLCNQWQCYNMFPSLMLVSMCTFGAQQCCMSTLPCKDFQIQVDSWYLSLELVRC